jgi:hypothetical protein
MEARRAHGPICCSQVRRGGACPGSSALRPSAAERLVAPEDRVTRAPAIPELNPCRVRPAKIVQHQEEPIPLNARRPGRAGTRPAGGPGTRRAARGHRARPYRSVPASHERPERKPPLPACGRVLLAVSTDIACVDAQLVLLHQRYVRPRPSCRSLCSDSEAPEGGPGRRATTHLRGDGVDGSWRDRCHLSASATSSGEASSAGVMPRASANARSGLIPGA